MGEQALGTPVRRGHFGAGHGIGAGNGGRAVLLRRTGATGWSEGVWARLATRLDAWKSLVANADRLALRPGGCPAELADQLRAAPAEFELLLHRLIGDGAAGSTEQKARLGARVQAELLPYLLLSRNAERWYAKPRGYAGDFLSIAWIYENQPAGVGRLGAALDRGFLELRAARAVFNRRALLAEQIRQTVTAAGGRTAEVTSLACGPAQELLDVFPTLERPELLRASLIDLDEQALAHVRVRADAVGIGERLTGYQENLIKLATGRRGVPISGQDLVYSIGLIDYFPDRFVVKLMDMAHGMLRPGGRLILGNFHPRNASKAMMDHVLDWRLIHRDEADMDRLFQASAFGRECSAIRYEPQRINLFAECVKE